MIWCYQTHTQCIWYVTYMIIVWWLLLSCMAISLFFSFVFYACVHFLGPLKSSNVLKGARKYAHLQLLKNSDRARDRVNKTIRERRREIEQKQKERE